MATTPDPHTEPKPVSETIAVAGAPQQTGRDNDAAVDAPVPADNIEPRTAGGAHAAGVVPFVVAMGASAGGLEPIEQFFANMPQDSGLAFVIVQHLSPNFKSLMKELLARRTGMAIHRVEDAMPVMPNSIYLIPPKKTMRLEGGKLRLYEPQPRDEQIHLPIDHFFESVARELGPRAVGVILSGTGSDGTKGVRAVHDAGGLVFVQEPETAQFDGMPRSAIQTDAADYILPIESIAEVIFRYAKRATTAEDNDDNDDGPEEAFLRQVNDLLRRSEGVDFAHYRSSTVLRRIDRRIAVLGLSGYEAYLDRLRDDTEEREMLREDLLISVTCFFRDPECWASLRRDVIAPIVEGTERNGQLRAWVTACSTGEEAYSLAMLIREEMDAQSRQLDVKIFATDVDPTSLERAAEGVYPESIASDVSEDRLRRFFTRGSSTYQVSRELREMLIFARHDLTKNAPFTKMNLVTCRNVLIYMQPQLQQQVISNLHFALNPHGSLLLGSAETLGDLESEFKPIDRKAKIFEKKRHVLLSHGHRSAIASGRLQGGVRSLPVPAPPRADAYFGPGLQRLFSLDRAVCLMIDEHGHLVHSYGEAGLFLQTPSGRMSTEVYQLVRPELSTSLRTAMHRAKAKRVQVSLTGIQLPDRDEQGRGIDVDMRTVFCEDSRSTPEFFVVYLRAKTRDASVPEVGSERAEHEMMVHDRVEELEHELQQNRENLQATIEELETTNEEQQSTNEELLASNEELQSTNEELHSVNEELYTVNAEHQRKIAELTEANNDIDNLLRSTDIGTLFLDPQLRIRKFTPSATAYFNLVEHDIGRPIGHLSHRLEHDGLVHDLSRVALSGGLIEREISTADGGQVLLRVTPYRTGQAEHRGVVLTIVDVSELVRVRRELELSERRFRQMAETITSVFWSASPDGDRVLYVSPAFEPLWGRSCDELYNDPSVWLEAVHEDDRAIVGQVPFSAGDGEGFDIEFRIRQKNGDIAWIRNRAYPVRDASGAVLRVVGVAEDCTQRIEALAYQQQLASIVETSDDAIAGCDDEATVTSWNGAAEALWGTKAGDAKGRPLTDFVTLPGGISDLLARLRAGERVDTFERLGGGDRHDAMIRISPVRDGAGRFVGASVIARDITDQRRLAAAFREQEDVIRAHADEVDYMYSTAPAPMCLLDADLRVERANERMANIAGLEPDACKGLPVGEVAPDLGGRLEPILSRVSRTGVPEIQRRVETETAVWLVSAFPVGRGDGAVRSVGVLLSEITEITRTQTELERVNEELRDQHKQMEQFVYTVSHDLKSPLVTIDGAVTLLGRAIENGAPAGELSGFVDQLAQTSSRMRTSIDDLLEFTRIGRAERRRVEVNTAAVVESVVASMKAELKKAKVSFTVASDLPTVHADGRQLGHAVANLLSNVVAHAAGEKGCRAAITAETGDGGGVRLVVTDEGPGIPEEHRERVFELFERLSPASDKGSGIGLAIVRRVMENAGGTATLETPESGTGCRFVLSFPPTAECAAGEKSNA